MRTWGLFALAATGACSFSGHGTLDPDAAAIDTAGAIDGAIDAATDAPPDAPRPWWDPAYPVRMQIVVANAAALPAGYQLSIDLDVDAAPCGSAQGARIVENHTTELHRIVEPSPALAGVERIWWKTTAALPVDAGPTSYWLYCGAPGATQVPADAGMIFDFFDEFDGATLSTARWTARNGVSVTGGDLKLDGNESVASIPTFGPGVTLEWAMRATATNGQYWGGLQSGATGTYAAPWVVWIARQPNALHGEALPDGTSEPGGNVIGIEHAITQISIAYAIEYQPGHAYIRFQNGIEQDLAGTVSPPLRVRFENYNENAAIFVGSVRVRKAVRPAPMASLGAPEPY